MVNKQLMEKIVEELQIIVSEYQRKLSQIPDETFNAKPLPHKWSKKEVVGHLVDSAQNNLRRFVCSQYETPPPLIIYQQDFWVSSIRYQTMERRDVIELWRLVNLQICSVLSSMPAENYTKECNTGSLHSLQWLAGDYVKHLKHHLNQIISGSFDVIYP